MKFETDPYSASPNSASHDTSHSGWQIGSKTRLRLYIAFWVIIIVSFAVTIWTQLYRLDTLAAQEAQLLEQLAAARQTTRELEYDLQLHYTDAFVERIARERLDFIRADETIFINDAR